MTCAIYCRLSREDEEKTGESESIQNQRAMLADYALRQEWEIYGVYCDEDYSGADSGRPGLATLLRAARAGAVDIVLCKSQSRFTRDMEMVEKYIHGLFPQWGVRFVAVVDNIDTAVKGGKKARQINGLVNEWYLEDLSDNIRAVFDQKRREGRHIGSTAAYGYRKNPGLKGHLLLDEEAAGVVREIYRLYLEGWGTRWIADSLNARGIASPGAYKGGEGADGRTLLWSGTAISRILRGELYLGVMVQGVKRKVSYKSKKTTAVPKEQWIRVPDTHEAIVSPQMFEAVQRRMRTRTRSDGTGQAHPLAGKVRCMDCGSAMQKTAHRYKGTRRCYLQCGLYAATRRDPRCSGHSIRLDALTDLVGERIGRLLEGAGLPGDLSLYQKKSAPTGLEGPDKELATLRRREARLLEAEKSLYLDKVEGVVTREQFRELGAALREEREDLARRAALLEERRDRFIREGEDTAGLSGGIQGTSQPGEVGRELIDLLVDRVEVGEKDAATGVQRIRIRWRV